MDCSTCKHFELSYAVEPCASCRHSKFEPKNKEEKKMDNRKTKAQLMEELEQKNSEIAALKELERSENYELCVKAGKEMRDTMDGLVAGGLTEEQAFQFVLAGAQLAARRRI